MEENDAVTGGVESQTVRNEEKTGHKGIMVKTLKISVRQVKASVYISSPF